MTPTTLQPPAPPEETDAPDTPAQPSTPYAHLEPDRDGILFAIACVLGSVLLYATILLTHTAA